MNTISTAVFPAPLTGDVHRVATTWMGKMHFASSVNNHTIHIDKLKVHGGDDRGPRPKQLLLSAAAGCVGMELMAILEKMRIEIGPLEINVSASLSDSVPKVYKEVQLEFLVKCNIEDRKKFEKALALTLDKYCGVIAMFRNFAIVTHEIQYVK